MTAVAEQTTEVRTAVQEAEAAELAAVELAERVRDGDTKVTPAALAAAEQKGVFARLRIESARRTAAARLESERQQRAQAVAADVRQLVDNDDPEEIAASMRAAVDAVTALYEVVAARQARIREMSERVAVVESELTAAGIAERTHARYGVGRSPVSGKLGVLTSDASAVGVAPADALAAVVGLAVADAGARTAIGQAMQHSSARADRVRAEVPAVAAEFGRGQ